MAADPHPHDDALLLAAIHGDVARIDAALAAGANRDARGEFGETALLLAARHSQPDTVIALLDRGFDPEHFDTHGNTLLHYLAVDTKLERVLCAAIERGADREARNRQGVTPALLAAHAGNAAAVRILHAAGADPFAQNVEGSNLLHELTAGTALRFRQRAIALDLVRELLAAGVDPNCDGAMGTTAFTEAADDGDTEVLRLFVEFGHPVDRANARSETPLQAAVLAGRREAALFLLDAGASCDLHSAAGLGDVARLHSLVERKRQNIDTIQGRDWARITPLGVALRNGQSQSALWLLAYGADANGANPEISHLHCLLRQADDTEVLAALIQRGADLERADGDDNTPLNYAARYDRLACAELLLQAGANPNAETERGYTPKQFAVSQAMRDLLRRHGGRA